MTLTLAETTVGDPSNLPHGTDVAALHAAATSEIADHLGAAHASLFARPIIDAGRIIWTAPGAEVRRFADLPAADRQAMLAAAGSMVSDIRRLVESGRAPALRPAWPAMRGIPGPGALFAVDGRPVLAPWGRQGSADLLGAYDDGLAWQSPLPVRWLPHGVALLAAALLALAAGLLLPAVAPWAQPPGAACRIAPWQIDLMRRQADAEDRGLELKKLLAAVNDDIGRQRLLCPIPQAKSTAPPPAPHAELPADRWNRHDLSMLDGCWHSTTQMHVQDERTGRIDDLREWRLCFDRNGFGKQSVRLTDGSSCSGFVSAKFGRDNRLFIGDRTKCVGPHLQLLIALFQCTRISDSEADCIIDHTEGPPSPQSGRFRR